MAPRWMFPTKEQAVQCLKEEWSRMPEFTAYGNKVVVTALRLNNGHFEAVLVTKDRTMCTETRSGVRVLFHA